MQPQDPYEDRKLPKPQPHQRDTPTLTSSARPQPQQAPSSQREAAAQIIHDQIDRLYENESPYRAAEQAITKAEDQSAYQRTHDNQVAYSQAHEDQLQQYHTAWQNYYQKYYEKYYVQQLQSSQQQIAARAQQAAQPHPPAPSPVEQPQATPVLTKDEAVNELRTSLVNKVKQQAKKARKSRHFIPIISAVAVALVFVFIQYNRQIIAQAQAYVSPGSISPQNIVLDPTTQTQVSDEPRLIIPKINVDAPVVYGLTSIEENVVQAALDNGVVHYPIPGASSLPGQAGNSVILGHSSNDVFNTGAYKFIFVQLDQLNEGDTFYAHYEGTRYTYSVTSKEIIEPHEVGKLVLNTTTPMMTLVTCTPPGTALKRLVVYAEQISPNPAEASAAPQQPDTTDSIDEIPDYYAPTFFEWLFGRR